MDVVDHSLPTYVLCGLLVSLTSRFRLVAKAASGKHVEPVPCSPPPTRGKMDDVLSEKVLKVNQPLKFGLLLL